MSAAGVTAGAAGYLSARGPRPGCAGPAECALRDILPRGGGSAAAGARMACRGLGKDGARCARPMEARSARFDPDRSRASRVSRHCGVATGISGRIARAARFAPLWSWGGVFGSAALALHASHHAGVELDAVDLAEPRFCRVLGLAIRRCIDCVAVPWYKERGGACALLPSAGGYPPAFLFRTGVG